MTKSQQHQMLLHLITVNDQYEACKNTSPNCEKLDNVLIETRNGDENLEKDINNYINFMSEKQIHQLFKLKKTIENLQNFMMENNISLQYDKERASNFEKTYMNKQ